MVAKVMVENAVTESDTVQSKLSRDVIVCFAIA